METQGVCVRERFYRDAQCRHSLNLFVAVMISFLIQWAFNEVEVSTLPDIFVIPRL